jgi:hypothetical protein
MYRKLTLLYQNPTTSLRDWYAEIFGPWIDRVVDDGTRTVVMDDCLVSDSFAYLQDPAYYRQFRGRNAFLLLSPDEYYATPPDLFRNFCGVFRSHWSGAFSDHRVKQIPTGYHAYPLRLRDSKPASQRKYLWNFLGEVNKTTRPDCLRQLIPIEPNFWFAADNWRPDHSAPIRENPRLSRDAYHEVLFESAFTPCPMGNVSQESHRPYEALEVGSIPILEKRLFMDAHRNLHGDHPLPTFFRWKDAAEFMADLWRHPAELDALQRRCMAWWVEYKVRLTREIGEFLAGLQDQIPTPQTRYVAPYVHIPGWAWFELARHHSPRAFMRRVQRQSRRLLASGRFFVHK